MMKSFKQALLIVLMLSAAVGSIALVSTTSFAINEEQQQPETKPPLPAKYGGNSNKSDSEFKLKTQDEVTKLLGNRKIKEIKFLMWKDAKPATEYNLDIDGNRKVWKVTADYVGGIDFDGGRCKSNAKLTQVLDAETGDNLMFEVRCPKGSFESDRPKPIAEDLRILENSR
ncbi:hypothetical protein [Nostoc sp. 'Peltigera membranacea cyanobiont' N6]|uniref:hypothetical protein n=1 Tax=Nostoc sp. 'Peltigera membranacea cyanobiont' N6 TaxID=1261031 RepID=UPI0011B0EA5C|nr:hypothetical protein [Nostoc sp. 'Peltigera membranacea cyanobiont' N6]